MDDVIIVGSGKLAKELSTTLRLPPDCRLSTWSEPVPAAKAILVHSGSGRQLPEVIAFCKTTGSTLLELATGSSAAGLCQDFPLVLCPNTNILMLKFMNMMADHGHRFEEYDVDITESHQEAKSSTPGTAVALAAALGKQPNEILSIRDRRKQRELLAIPEDQLDRHAYHRITICDPWCSITMESRVFGDSPYAAGVERIITAIRSNRLSDRVYEVEEFVRLGWV